MRLRTYFFCILITTAILNACGGDTTSNSPINEGKPSSSSGTVSDTLIDSRDGQTYKVVTIGSQTWMAENLNYKMDGSSCYNDSLKNCEQYGRLYTWNAAMEACPEKWHLPDSTEWNILIEFGGGKNTAGKTLKAATDWPFINYGDGTTVVGTDDYGFSILPGGLYLLPDDEAGYVQKRVSAHFWTAIENFERYIQNNHASFVGPEKQFKGTRLSVRCLKD